MMDISSAAHATQTVTPVFRLQHHTRGQPCGLLIEGGIYNALDTSSMCMSARRSKIRFSIESGPCHWGGKCNIRVGKGTQKAFRAPSRRWKCLKCLRTYSRDDSARKHANVCGDGSIAMVTVDGRSPKLEREWRKGEEHIPKRAYSTEGWSTTCFFLFSIFIYSTTSV